MIAEWSGDLETGGCGGVTVVRLGLRERWVDRIGYWRVKARHSSGVDG